MSQENEAWDGVISKLKVSRTVYPELFTDLAGIGQRDRGERLRLLAYIGLQAMRIGSGVDISHRGDAPNARRDQDLTDSKSIESSVSEKNKERRSKLLGSIHNS